MEGFNAEEFTDVVKRFITCHRNTCDTCEYADECDADVANGLSFSTRLADMLEPMLPELEKLSEASMMDFISLLKGE